MMSARRVAARLLALSFLLVAAVGAGAREPTAVAGRLELAGNLQAPVDLRGQWGFAWQQFVDPGWETLPTTAFAPVPSSWNDVSADGKPPGEDGWGSYVLQVDCPRGESLAVEATGQRTASRLFVNGTEVAAHGEPGRSRGATWAAVHNRVPITHEFPCPLRLTLHVANYDHRAGGFVRPLAAGPNLVLEERRETRIIANTALLSIYLLTGLVALIFYAVRRRERITLVYGLFCIAMAVYSDMITERLFLRMFPPQVDWFAYMRAEYLSWVAAMALFFLALRGLFPAEIHKRALQVVLGALVAAGVAVVALPPGIYSYLAVPGQAVAVVVGVYVAVAMLRARGRSRLDARVLLAGMLAVLVGLVVDLVLIDVPGRPDQKFAQFGFALFLLSPAVVIARRLSQALNAEERGRTLEENARLREDVERISRHDLKTPLNSILSASRLLAEDGRLGADQQELVGVLQGAGLRMLEMVNLSLGLFKMETGTYQLRPQPMDLREVVSRVMVDLHAYADAEGVTLHLQDSDSAPVYVRAEELLCYSIIANIVKNAIEAVGPGRQVSISVRREDPAAVCVHNPGTVPREIAERFFEKYVTGNKSGGTGLGTYSARLMARAQHGDLTMQTGEDGTTLTLTLPPTQEVPPPRMVAAGTEAPQSHWLHDMPARHVLLVDDDEFIRLVNRRLLPSPPFSVETAHNGQAAIEAMARRWPDYLLIDMEMPVRNGIETVRWVREQEATVHRPRCRVIMISGNDEEASVQRALDAGADRFLVKPVSRERLFAAVRELELQLEASEAHAAAPDGDHGNPDPKVIVEREWQEVFPEFLRLQRETVEKMAKALATDARQDLHFLAHRAYGGLAAMGMEWAARQSRILERDALHAGPHDLEPRIQALREHLASVEVEYR